MLGIAVESDNLVAVRKLLTPFPFGCSYILTTINHHHCPLLFVAQMYESEKTNLACHVPVFAVLLWSKNKVAPRFHVREHDAKQFTRGPFSTFLCVRVRLRSHVVRRYTHVHFYLRTCVIYMRTKCIYFDVA